MQNITEILFWVTFALTFLLRKNVQHIYEWLLDNLEYQLYFGVYCTGWRKINRTIYFCCPSSVFLQQNTCDNVRVAARTLVKAVLNVSSTGCNNERHLRNCPIARSITSWPICSQQVCMTYSGAQRLECDDDGKQAVGMLPRSNSLLDLSLGYSAATFTDSANSGT